MALKIISWLQFCRFVRVTVVAANRCHYDGVILHTLQSGEHQINRSLFDLTLTPDPELRPSQTPKRHSTATGYRISSPVPIHRRHCVGDVCVTHICNIAPFYGFNYPLIGNSIFCQSNYALEVFVCVRSIPSPCRRSYSLFTLFIGVARRMAI